MNLEKLNQLEELCEKYVKAPWKTIDKRLEDDSQKWVMYQASLEDHDEKDKRLQFVVDIINNLPELLKAAKKTFQPEEDASAVTALQVKELISAALISHEKAKH